MRKKPTKPNAIEKSLDILMAFVPGNPEMGTLEISEKMGLHKATASRILLTLTRRGFLKQNPKTKKFCLGRSALLIGRAVVDSIQNDLVPIARPYVDQLCNRLNETVVIEQLGDENSIIMVYVTEGRQRYRIAGSVGDRLPFYSAAGAKAILAYSDPQLVARILDNAAEFPQITPNTISDPQVLIQQLQTIRLKGAAFDNEENDIGINAVAAPIFNHENHPVASVVVVGPAHRIKLDHDSMIVKEAKETATKISAALMQD